MREVLAYKYWDNTLLSYLMALGIEFDRAHFLSFGDSQLTFEVVYFVRTGDFNQYMDRQQAINLALFDAFAQEGIEFAYPTQTLFVQHQQGIKTEMDVTRNRS